MENQGASNFDIDCVVSSNSHELEAEATREESLNHQDVNDSESATMSLPTMSSYETNASLAMSSQPAPPYPYYHGLPPIRGYPPPVGYGCSVTRTHAWTAPGMGFAMRGNHPNPPPYTMATSYYGHHEFMGQVPNDGAYRGHHGGQFGSYHGDHPFPSSFPSTTASTTVTSTPAATSTPTATSSPIYPVRLHQSAPVFPDNVPAIAHGQGDHEPDNARHTSSSTGASSTLQRVAPAEASHPSSSSKSPAKKSPRGYSEYDFDAYEEKCRHASASRARRSGRKTLYIYHPNSLASKYPDLVPVIKWCMENSKPRSAFTVKEIQSVVIAGVPGIRERGGIACTTISRIIRYIRNEASMMTSANPTSTATSSTTTSSASMSKPPSVNYSLAGSLDGGVSKTCAKRLFPDSSAVYDDQGAASGKEVATSSATATTTMISTTTPLVGCDVEGATQNKCARFLFGHE